MKKCTMTSSANMQQPRELTTAELNQVGGGYIIIEMLPLRPGAR